MKLHKKAQALNAITETSKVGIGIAFFVLVVIFMTHIGLRFKESTETLDIFGFPLITQVYEAMVNYPVIFDWVAFVVFIVALIASLWGFSRVELPSIMYVASYFLLIFAGIGFLAIGLILNTLVTMPIMADSVANMVFIPYFAGNYVLFMIIYGFACLLALHIPSQ